ncbi:MAG: glycosyl hydrolase 53 family protein [Clostridiales bacterium]|nr:glycosyl hydrolase 53 family protein [Clostridiales bacterium]
MKQKILAAVLALMMVVSVMQPFYVSAEEGDEEASSVVAAEEAEASDEVAEPAAEEGLEETVEDTTDESSPVYAVAASANATEVTAGDTVSLSASVTVDGTEVTDLEGEGLYLWWWTDVWAADHASGNSDSVYSNYDNGSGYSLSADVTLPSTGTYYIAAELQDSGWNRLAIVYVTITVSAAEVEVEMSDLTASLTNPDFETGDSTGWTLNGFYEVKTDSWASNNTTSMLNLWLSDSEAVEGSASYTVALTAGTYQFGFDTSGSASGSSLIYTVTAGDTVLADSTAVDVTSGWDVWVTNTTAEFTLTEETEVTFTLSGTVAAGDWGYLDNLTLSGTGSVVEAEAEMTDLTASLTNPDFETGDSTGWTLTGFSSITTDSWASNNTTYMLSLWLSDSEAVEGSASYTVALTAGTYQFGFDTSGSASGSSLIYTVTAGDTVLADSTAVDVTSGWDVWVTNTTAEFTLTEETEVTFTLSGTVAAGDWGYLDNLTLSGTGSVVEDDTSVEADINVDKVSSLTEDFIMGMDISSIISEFNSGVVYYDFDGNKIDNITDFCKFLAECGVTTIRVRVWNDPYDSDGNGYGGGNNDVATAVKIAQGCAAAGLRMLVDFHYSDFWADPGKYDAPKAWEGMTVDEKAEALYDFTEEALNEIAATGVTIWGVQVGNETTGGIAGVSNSDLEGMCTLFSAGAAAIRAVSETIGQDIKVVIHVTNPEKSRLTQWAGYLDTYDVDYDVLATSYYPYWHGTFANLQSQMEAVQNTYGKDVMVAETSYAYTLDDTDGHDNTVRVGNNDTGMSWAYTVQGQASFIRDLIEAVSDAGGLGVFYWESAWITVGDTTGLEGDEYDAQVTANKVLWEKYGSGWASSFAAEYDPDDAGVWYGGSAIDNQAMFAADGTPLASINVWNYVKTGAYSNTVSVDDIEAVSESIVIGDSYTLPETVTVTYNSGAVAESVVWNEDDVAAIDTGVQGTYVVSGTVTLSREVNSGDYAGETTVSTTYTLTVKGVNLIGDDWSFENGGDNFSGLGSNGTKISNEDPYDGTYALHWYLSSAATSNVTYLGENQEGITLEPGVYSFEAYAQGYAGDTVTLSVLNHDSGETIATGEAVTLTGWAAWATPTVTFTVTETTTVDLGITIVFQAGGWGTVDCMYLSQTGELTAALDLTELEAIVAQANALTESDYTADSWSALADLLDEADAILNGETDGLTQDDIDELVANITAAIQALVEQTTDPSTPDTDTDTDATLLSTPELTGVSSGTDGVTVTWEAVEGAEQYVVLRRTADSEDGWEAIGATYGTSYTDTDVISGQTYYYTVACLDADGNLASDYDDVGLSICWNASDTDDSDTGSSSSTSSSGSSSSGSSSGSSSSSSSSSGSAKTGDSSMSLAVLAAMMALAAAAFVALLVSPKKHRQK